MLKSCLFFLGINYTSIIFDPKTFLLQIFMISRILDQLLETYFQIVWEHFELLLTSLVVYKMNKYLSCSILIEDIYS